MASDPFKRALPEPVSVTLGHMSASHIMGYHEGMRRSAGLYAESAKKSAMGSHPSAGSRSAEFHSQAMHLGMLGEAARTDAVSSAVFGKTRGASFTGRAEHFDQARKMGREGSN